MNRHCEEVAEGTDEAILWCVIPAKAGIDAVLIPAKSMRE